jgi:hypothetical protein
VVRIAEQAVDLWRDLQLGTSSLIRLSPLTDFNGAMTFTGGGEGIHWMFFKQENMQKVVSQQGKYFMSKPNYWAWQRLILSDIKRHCPEDMDPRSFHFREFRVRFTGANSNFSPVCSLLASWVLLDCSIQNDEERLKDNQLLFDLIANLFPEIMTDPYDQAYKGHTATAISRLTRVDFDETPSQSFGRFESRPEIWDTNQERDVLRDQFETAVSGPSA